MYTLLPARGVLSRQVTKEKSKKERDACVDMIKQREWVDTDKQKRILRLTHIDIRSKPGRLN